MTRSQKLKRVSWAPDVHLCQVRLFLSEDAPSQSGLGAQDHLQAKASWLWHSTVADSDGNLPPGFEGSQARLCQFPLIKWRCPPRLMLNPDWLVVAGEESKEVDFQKQRELRVLEAVYPRPSAIPPSPSVSSEVHDYNQDNRHTPLIPITPVEDVDAADSFDSAKPNKISQPGLPKSLHGMGITKLVDLRSALERSHGNVPAAPNPQMPIEKPAVGTVPSVEPDVVAAASAAVTAIMKSNEQGSLIDCDLLIKILSNPKLIEQLVSEHGGTPNNAPVTLRSSVSLAASISVSQPPQSYSISMEADTSLIALPPSQPLSPPPLPPMGHLYPVPNTLVLGPPPPPVPSKVTSKAPPVKDINYYKSLIQQHGGDNQEVQYSKFVQLGNHHNRHSFGANVEPIQSSKQNDLRPKIPTPCLYFKSSKGCQHGSNCQFVHVGSLKQRIGSVLKAPSSKRLKMEREIDGRS